MIAPDASLRVAVLHEVARAADDHQRAYDPATMPQSADEWVTRLVVALGCVGCAEDGAELDGYLLSMAADALLWLEAREQERAV
jgi:hypothetical protein